MRLVVARLHTVTRCCRLDLRTVDCYALRQKLSVLLVSFVAKSSVSRAACFSPSISGSVRGSFVFCPTWLPQAGVKAHLVLLADNTGTAL